MKIEDRVDKALTAHSLGYNCIQSVIIGYADLFHMDQSELLTMTMGLGKGVGGNFEICGTALGGAMVISRKYGTGDSNVKQKHEVEKKIKDFIDEFRDTYGAVTCGELLGIRKTENEVHKKSCHEMVGEVVRMLEKYL